MGTTADATVIVLTGGPCGGKSTALCYIEEKLRDMGYAVFIVPETPTRLMQTGIRPSGAGFAEKKFQDLVFGWQVYAESFYKTAANMCSRNKKVIVCDRGIMDQKPYMRPDAFEKMLAKSGWHTTDARDSLYDAVFHLRTAALGAEKHYTTKNNKWRRETPEEAREKDAQTLDAWMGHPHLRVIDNSTNFEGKLKRLFREVTSFLGVPSHIETERKFLIADVNYKTLYATVPVQEIDILQAYLPREPNGDLRRIRRRGQDGAYVYYETRKRKLPDPMERLETERRISAKEFATLFKKRDKKYAVIEKKRLCFLWNEQYFELDKFIAPHKDLLLLEIELTDKNDAVSVPPFIRIKREVTGDKRFGNHSLAKKR